MYSLSVGVPLTILEAVAPFDFTGRTRKGRALQKKNSAREHHCDNSYHSGCKKKSSFFLENKYHRKHSCYPSPVIAESKLLM